MDAQQMRPIKSLNGHTAKSVSNHPFNQSVKKSDMVGVQQPIT